MSSEQVRTGTCGVLARGSPAILAVLDEVLPYPKTPTPSHSHGRWRRLKVSSSNSAMTCVCGISVLVQFRQYLRLQSAHHRHTVADHTGWTTPISISLCHAVTKGFAP